MEDLNSKCENIWTLPSEKNLSTDLTQARPWRGWTQIYYARNRGRGFNYVCPPVAGNHPKKNKEGEKE